MTTITVVELARDVDDFLVFKRALGYPYRRSEQTLRSFQRFVESDAHPGSRLNLEAILKRWLNRIDGRKPITVGLELGIIRQLCLYRRRRDPHSFVPDHALAPVVESSFVPHIFSYDEVHRILKAVEIHRIYNVSTTMLRTLVLVLYCTGLRLGEAARLQLQDIDLEGLIFVIRESKGRTRIVPFRADLGRELHTYLSERDLVAGDVNGDGNTALFLRRNGQPISLRTASQAIRRILRKIGIKPEEGRVGARPYEFRHAFAVHRLTDWYRHGIDIHARLPWLSAYMGHVNVLGTEVYLAATPELMKLASQRFEGRLKTARKTR